MSATEQAIELARVAARAAADKKGTDILGLDVSENLALTDIFLIISAGNERQVAAVVDAVDEAVRGAGGKAVRREGERENRWVLLDYSDIIVHVQQPEVRQTYSLERLWKDCAEVDLQLPDAVPDVSVPDGAVSDGAGE
ncbi:MAG: ribosome silencing factor [Acidipropionibacterium sp.]|nr:ribosome silencing factor [Acidipropionibacterium sp.]